LYLGEGSGYPIIQIMATLKLRRVAIDTYREDVAFLHRNSEINHSEGFQALSKIEIQRE